MDLCSYVPWNPLARFLLELRKSWSTHLEVILTLSQRFRFEVIHCCILTWKVFIILNRGRKTTFEGCKMITGACWTTGKLAVSLWPSGFYWPPLKLLSWSLKLFITLCKISLGAHLKSLTVYELRRQIIIHVAPNRLVLIQSVLLSSVRHPAESIQRWVCLRCFCRISITSNRSEMHLRAECVSFPCRPDGW